MSDKGFLKALFLAVTLILFAVPLNADAGTSPDAFNFIPQTGMPLSTVIVSNPITVTGIDVATNISISGGEYAISTDAGSTWGGWTSTAGTVSVNDQVEVHLTSSVSGGTRSDATLIIGDKSGAFYVTTAGTALFLNNDFESDPNGTVSPNITGWDLDFYTMNDGGTHGTGPNVVHQLNISTARSYSGTKSVYSFLRNVGGDGGGDTNTRHATHDLTSTGPFSTSADTLYLWRSDVSYTTSSRYNWHLNVELSDGTNTDTIGLACIAYGNSEGCSGNYQDTSDLQATGSDGQTWSRHPIPIPAIMDRTNLTIKIRHQQDSWDGTTAESSLYYDLVTDGHDAFRFASQTGMPLSTTIVSNPTTVSGISDATAISITGGEYAISTDGGSTWGSWTSSSGTINLNNQVMVRQTSSASNSTLTTATLTIGGVSADFNVTTAASGDPDASGLVSWWKAENNAYDSVGGNNGTLVNGTAYATGKTGQAFSFNGTDDFISVLNPQNIPIGNNPLTITAWVKSSGAPGQYQGIVGYGTPSASQVLFFEWGGNDVDYLNRLFTMNLSTGGGGATILAYDTWYHVALTHDGSNTRLYVNGQLDSDIEAMPQNTVMNSDGLRIGKSPDFDVYHTYFKGLIDEVKIFNRALSAAEVSKLAGMLPDAFTFIAQTGMPLSTVIVSNPITVTGISSPAAISITGNGGEYTISTDGGSTWGSWTSTAGTVSVNNQVKVRQTSSAGYSTLTTATLTIGGVSGAFNVTTAASGDPNGSGLVAWWKAENNAYDSVSGNNGTLVNGTVYAAGKVGQAFSFDGVDDSVSVGMLNNTALNETMPFSISAWINSSNTSPHQAIASNYMGENAAPLDQNYSTSLHIDSGNLTFELNKKQVSGDYTSTPISTGWHYVTATYDGSVLKLYLDGILKDSVTRDFSGATDNTRGWYIGNYSPQTNASHGFNSSFNGLIDELKIFNRALSAAEVSKLAGTYPDAFSFIAQTGMPVSTTIVSNPITVSGISSAAAISITGGDGQYAISTNNGSTWGSWTSTAGTVSVNNQVMVRQTSSASNSTLTPTTLTIGGVSADFNVTTAASGDPDASGLVSWWKAENNAYDSVGGNHGTPHGGVTYDTGQVGQAFGLDGDDYVKVNASSSLDVGLSDGFSINAWINPQDISSPHPLLEWNNGSEGYGPHFWIASSLGAGAGSLFANIMDTSGGYHNFSTATNILTANTYQHVALTFDKTTGMASIYANGTVVASQNLGIFVPQTSYDLFIGWRPNGPFYFNGLIDEVKIFNRALSALEVSTLAGTKPDAFSFTPQTGVAVSTPVESNTITVTGITSPAAISITGGEYSVSTNGGSIWSAYSSSAPATVSLNDQVKVRQTSSASYSTQTDATLTIGGVSGTFSVTTLHDTTPDPFTFTAQTGVALSTVITSNTITVSGIDAAATISITGGEYVISTDGGSTWGSWTSTAGTVSVNNQVKVRQTSSASYSTTTNATLTIGGVSGTFSVTTLPDTTPPTLNITSHTNGQHVFTSSITLIGTASDSGKGNDGIQQVTVNGVRASNDTATGSGTANWSKAITLNAGANSITVIAYDNSSNHNSTTVILTLYLDSGAPSVTTGPATKVTEHLATLQGTVNPNGLSTTYYFQWGSTTSYGNTTSSQSAGSGWDNVAVSANITGLTLHANYHFRLVATNSLGTTYGSDMSFIASVKAMPWLMLLQGN